MHKRRRSEVDVQHVFFSGEIANVIVQVVCHHGPVKATIDGIHRARFRTLAQQKEIFEEF